MDYTRFYTPPEIANLLINRLKIKYPSKIIDICCGSCNLLKAAKKRWKKADLYGVDIVEQTIDNIYYFKMDGRKFAVSHKNEFDLVLANPPFDFVKKKSEFSELFINPFDDIHSSRLEIEMLIANLLMLKQNGILLIILPSSFVEGAIYKKIRAVIARNYNIEEIIKLPEDTFGNSRINSYALIIRNLKFNLKPTKSFIPTGIDFGFSHFRDIPIKDIIEGEWLNYSVKTPIKEFDIKRGNISSSQFISKGQEILHTAKSNIIWQPSIRYISSAGKHAVYAEYGDIIVSRIGKSAGSWCLYTGKKIPISDCLYRIKDPCGNIYKKIQGELYDLPQKGVAARYITIADFEYWICSINSK